MSVIVPLYFASGNRGGRGSFLIVAAATALQMVLFETVDRSAAWKALAINVHSVPLVLLDLIAGGSAGALLWSAWRGRRAAVKISPAVAPA